MADIPGTPGNDTLNGADQNDVISGEAGNDTLNGAGGNDTLDGGIGNDRMAGGLGDDVYLVDSTKDVVNESASQGFDRIDSSVSLLLGANIEHLRLLGDADLNGTGNAIRNVIEGNTGRNQLDGGAGNDLLEGGAGNDILVGGAGQDDLVGDAGNDSLSGGAGNDFLEGDDGDNTLNGGAGDDRYFVASATDLIIEAVGGGTDTVSVRGSFNLATNGANVEGLTLFSDAGAVITGNALDNFMSGDRGNDTLIGGDGNDGLFGGAGADSLFGGAGDDRLDCSDLLNEQTGGNMMDGGVGNDTYVLRRSGDAIIEMAHGGTDSVLTFVDLILPANVENVQVARENLVVTGNELNNAMANFQSAATTFNGAAGNDTLHGGSGDDKLDGGDGNDRLEGGAGGDVLDGGAGNDTMIGGAGDDIYVVDSGKDVVTEGSGAGIDTVQSAISYTLGANLETLVLVGGGSLDGKGNALANALVGNTGDNRLEGGAGDDSLFGLSGTDLLIGGAGNDGLDGGAGDDVMQGGTGNDLYVIDGFGDKVVEVAGQGIDTIVTGLIDIDLSKFASVENVNLTGMANLHVTGSTLDNRINGNDSANLLTGEAGNDILDGKGGDDLMRGGIGNDTYFVDSKVDSVVENENEGVDTVQTAVNELSLGNNVENLTLLGDTDINGAGNELNNIIAGNDGSNILLGLDGNDTINGGAGGLDILDGGFGNDVLNGNDGDDLLEGGGGVDKMTGGDGNDVYRVDNSKDIVIEAANRGNGDTVQSIIDYTLGANLETLVLVGDADLDGTGNSLNNDIIGSRGRNLLKGGSGNDTVTGEIGPVGGDDTLIGGAGDDSLNGGVGNDVMQGGIGNDFYVIDSAGDKVVELAAQGTDLIVSSLDVDLSSIANVENVTLKDGGNLNAIGNALNNVLNGNDGVNALNGGAGNDILDGKAGADILRGGVGNDLYIVNNVNEDLAENAGEGIDTVHSTVIAFTLGDNFENLTLLGSNPISGSGNALNNVIIGNSALNDLFGFGGNDTLKGGEGNGGDLLNGGTGDDRMIGEGGNDIYVVDSAKDVVIETADQGLDLVQSTVSYNLGANLESLDLLGAGNLNGTGNALRNFITGNAGSNLLNGGAGDDSLEGNLGNDTLIGGTGNDTLSDGSGTDLIDGGQGQDTILLGGSDDAGDIVRYAINAASELATLGGDVISGFEHGADKIDLSDLFDQFNIESKDAIGDGFLKIEVTGLDTNILFDRNGGGDGFVTLATLSNVTNVTLDDVLTISA